MMRRRMMATAALVTAMLGGCVLPGPRSERPPTIDPVLLAPTTVATGPMVADWWRAFGDPQLDALVEEALAASPSLAAATARTARADAAAEAIGNPRRPTLDGNASVVRERYSATGLFPPPLSGRNYTDASLGLTLNWDFDLWGRQRSALDAARLRADATRIDTAAARLVLTTSVVSAYVAFDHAVQVRATAERSRASRAAVLDLTVQRRGAGLDTDVEVETARSAVAAADGDIAAADEQVSLARTALAALVGAGPARGATLTLPSLQAPVALALPADLPADLVARRPDIAANRLRIDAQAREIDSSRSAFYPNLNLVGTLGLDTLTPSELLNGSSRFFNIGPALNLPLYGHAALRGNLHGAEAAYDEAVANYNQAVIDSFHQVADAVNSLHEVDREEAAAVAARSSLERAFSLAELRYRNGLSNYLSVLVAQDRLLAQERLVVDVRSRRRELDVELIRALGGGFGDPHERTYGVSQ